MSCIKLRFEAVLFLCTLELFYKGKLLALPRENVLGAVYAEWVFGW